MTDSADSNPNEAVPAQASLRDWLINQSLPLWGEAGWDERTGLFIESLDELGQPLSDLPRRLMVQARQIFVFSIAAKRGWSGIARHRVERAADAMIRFYHQRDGNPGWVFSVDRAGTPVDPRRDFYTLSFVLLALANWAEISGDRRALSLADETLDFLDSRMAHPEGGYVDGLPLPADGQLRQNPHMHLLEAVLALHRVKPGEGYLDRARSLVSLLQSRFLQGRPPVLAEFFDSDWAVRGGADVSFEPGHHFEWVWLLWLYAKLAGDPLPEIAASLWSAAIEFGLGPGPILYDEASLGRGILQRSTRLWPYCEAAKAARILSPSTTASADFLTALQTRFLGPAVRGSWVDRFDADGVPKSRLAPASSLYHICCALDMLEQHGTDEVSRVQPTVTA